MPGLSCRHDRRGIWSMFKFLNLLSIGKDSIFSRYREYTIFAIGSLLDIFMLLITGRQGTSSITWRKWIENTNINKYILWPSPLKNLFITMSSLAPSCTLSEDKENSFRETDYNLGLVARCEQTSINSSAVKFLILLCLIERTPPLGQDRACSTEKDDPQAQCAGVWAGNQPCSILECRHVQHKTIFIKGTSSKSTINSLFNSKNHSQLKWMIQMLPEIRKTSGIIVLLK